MTGDDRKVIGPMHLRRRRAVVVLGIACIVTAVVGGGVGIARANSARHQASVPPPRPQASSVRQRPIPEQVSRSVHIKPLRRLTAPDAVVRLPHGATARAVQRLRKEDGVQDVAVLDRGWVRLGGTRMLAVGVAPSAVRGFTPSLTARSDALWESVASGEVTVAYAAAKPVKHELGNDVLVRGRHEQNLRIGAFASIGIGNAQVLVDHGTAGRLGISPGREVLVAAPHLSVDSLVSAVHAALGAHAKITSTRPQTVDQSTISSYAAQMIPADYLTLYRNAAATCPGLPWTVLAGIGAVETGHGANVHTSTKGAEGPMQFLPSTFRAYGVDGNGDGVADIQNPADAIYSAARYLCAAGAGRGGQSLYDAIWAYNHADWYVRLVVQYAQAYSP